MSMPTKPGTYIGFARSAAIEQREGKCPRWIASFQLGQFFNGTEWEPLHDDSSITGYFTLINTNGQPNDINCQAIIDAYDLPKFDFKTLESFDFSGIEVQLVLDYRDFTATNGQTKRVIDVKYLNHRNYERKSLASDPAVVQSLDAKYGALLRAKFKPKHPAGGSNGSARTHAAPPTPGSPTDPVEVAKRTAWGEFKVKTPTLAIGDRNKKWTETVQGYAGKPVNDLDVNDWQNVARIIAEQGPWQEPVPVASNGEAPPIPEDDLPF